MIKSTDSVAKLSQSLCKLSSSPRGTLSDLVSLTVLMVSHLRNKDHKDTHFINCGED